MRKKFVVAALILAAAAVPAGAAVSITGKGLPITDAALVGGTAVDFENTAYGTYQSLTYGDLTITGQVNVVNLSAGYNTSGTHALDNVNGNTTQTLVLTFANAVSAFALNAGAVSGPWAITANGQSVNYGGNGSDNTKSYYGITGVGDFTTATVTFAPNDYLFLDNFTYKAVGAAAAVPEPASWAMMIGGFGMIGATLRSRRRTSVVFG